VPAPERIVAVVLAGRFVPVTVMPLVIVPDDTTHPVSRFIWA